MIQQLYGPFNTFSSNNSPVFSVWKSEAKMYESPASGVFV